MTQINHRYESYMLRLCWSKKGDLLRLVLIDISADSEQRHFTNFDELTTFLQDGAQKQRCSSAYSAALQPQTAPRQAVDRLFESGDIVAGYHEGTMITILEYSSGEPERE